MTDEERWLPVVGYQGLYEVSDQGRVRSLDRVVQVQGKRQQRRQSGKILAPGKTGDRLTVSLADAAHRHRSHYVHVLVLEAFVGPCPGPNYETCHGNGVGVDNRLSNIRWDTRSENTHDRVRHGTHHAVNKTHCPTGHLLSAPNLVPSKLPHRKCLACNRAQSSYNYYRKQGRPFDLLVAAERHYQGIMVDA